MHLPPRAPRMAVQPRIDASASPMPVRQLPEQVVNRIAAGEVVERPASVVKELVENAIDAGASRVDIFTDGGGRRRIGITDDGSGMTHARSRARRRPPRHLQARRRGSACAFARSGSAARPCPRSARWRGSASPRGIASEPHAWSLSVEGGEKSQIMPAALSQGTRVEVSDLFYATPARLKFLKTDRTEAEAIREVVRRLAMARPDIAFTLAGEERAPVTWAAALPGAAGRLTRLGDILGSDFRSSAIEVRAEREGVVVEGFAAAPSLTRANALGQYLFVNGRPVRDKLILGAVRAAYSDYLPRDRHPVVALFVTTGAAGGRCQCASGQDRGAVSQRRPRPRADRACAEGWPRPRGPAHRRQYRRRPRCRRSVRPLRRARATGTGGVRRPIRSTQRLRSEARSRRRSPKRARPPSMSARRPPTCASRRNPPPTCSTVRSARRGRRSTRPISCRRPATA